MHDHLSHTGLIIQVLWQLAILHKIQDFVVKLWDLQIEILLVLLHVLFHALFNLSNLILKARDLLLSIRDCILVFLLNLESEIGQDVHVLAVQVDLISLWLEISRDSFKVLLLGDEIRHICDMPLHLSD